MFFFVDSELVFVCFVAVVCCGGFVCLGERGYQLFLKKITEKCNKSEIPASNFFAKKYVILTCMLQSTSLGLHTFLASFPPLQPMCLFSFISRKEQK